MAKRRYKEQFLDLGFTEIEDHGVSKPQCVLCMEVLSNESLKENKLKRHLETKHPAFLNNDRGFFERKEMQLKRQKFDTQCDKGPFSLHRTTTMASYLAAWIIAKQKKPHTIGENLVKPAAVEMVRIVCGDDTAKKIQQIPLSNDTVHSRIIDMSIDIKNQVIEALKTSGKFSLQLDESTDISDEAQLMAYVRYQGATDMQEEFLFCKPFHSHTTGEDIFKMVDSFFQDEGLTWNQCYSVCCDGAPAMFGARKGFTSRVKNVNPEVLVLHCILHRENLAAQRLSGELNVVMKEVVQVVNFIKGRSLNSRLFNRMCQDFASEHTHLLYHSEVRWLSRGKVLQRVLELRVEIQIFLVEEKNELASRFDDSKWLLQVAYLTDIFAEINNLNAAMQGRQETLVGTVEKLTAFKDKLSLWKRRISIGRTAPFPNISLILQADNATSFDEIKPIVVGHLEKLMSEFQRYIPEDISIYSWVKNPFDVKIEDLPKEMSDIHQLEEQLIDIQNDKTLEYNFKKETLSVFWTKIHKEKDVLGSQALKVLLPFPTTYLCEAGFSALTVVKTKYRNRLAPEHDLRCCLSSTKPRFEDIAKKVQSQISH